MAEILTSLHGQRVGLDANDNLVINRRIAVPSRATTGSAFPSITTTGGTINLTEVQAAASHISVTGALTSDATLVFPAGIPSYLSILNSTTGSYLVKAKASGQSTTVNIRSGYSKLVFSDGITLTEGNSDATGNAAVYVSAFGAPTGSDDSSIVQAAFTAAIAGSRRLVFDDPTGTGTTWIILTAPSDTTGALSAPRISSIDTSTGLVTCDRSHKLRTGDVISLMGSNTGSGGGLTQINAYTEYFVSAVSSTTLKIYDTKAHATSGGSTGLYIPSTGMTTTGAFNTLVTTVTVNNSDTTVTGTDASKVIPGDTLNFTGTNGTTYYTVASVLGNVITLTGAYSGTFASGGTIWVSSIDVASALTMESGTTLSFAGPGTSNNSFGSMIVTSVVGLTIHLNQPPNSNLPTPGASQSVLMGLQIDPKYLSLNFDVSCAPGAKFVKHASFSVNAIFSFSYMTKVHIHDNEVWGKTYGPPAALSSGDDGFRCFGCSEVRVERNIFRNFGDSVIRTHTGSYNVSAKSASYPQAGCYAFDVVIRDNYFLDIWQTSTTNTSNYYMGGARNVFMANNVFENIGGSIKFASRAPGAANVYITNNVVKNSIGNGIELDSFDNYHIVGNTLENIKSYGIMLIANNLQAIGYAFNNAKIKDNVITAGASTISGANGIRIGMDSYPDGTIWDYKGLEIIGNKIYDYPAGSIPINIISGCYSGMRVQDNLVENYAGNTVISFIPRISVTANFKNDIIFSGNIVKKCTGTKATFLSIVPSNGATGGPYVRDILVTGNIFDNADVSLGSSASNDGSFVTGDFLQDLRVTSNWWHGYGKNGVAITSEGKDIAVTNNDFTNLNTSLGVLLVFTNTNGIYIRNNKLNQQNTGSAYFSADRQCQNVRFFANDISDSARQTYSVTNIPLKTSADGLRREEWMSAAPSAGTWVAGDIYWLTAPASGTTEGGRCTASGSYSTISATGNSVFSGTPSPIITNVSSMTNICIGSYVTHPGFTGTRKVIAMTANTVTLDANATSDQTAGALANATPTMKAKASIA